MARTGLLRGRTKVEGGLLKVAVRRLSEETDVVFTYDDVLERLDETEQLSLIAIYGRLSTPLSPGAAFVPLGSPEDRANAREYAKWLREQPEDARGTRRKLAEFTERIERVPSDAELLVYNGAGAKDTHESLAPKLKELNAGVFTLADGRPRDVLNETALLDGDEERLRELIGKAADDPEVFERREREAEKRNGIKRMAAKLHAPKAKPRYDPAGSIRLPPAVHAHLTHRPRPAMTLVGLGLLALLVDMWENQECITPGGHLEGEGAEATLVIGRPGLGVRWDEDGAFSGWRKDAELLEANKFITIEKSNTHWKIGKGRRLLEIDEATA